MARVWEKSRHKGSDLLMMLAIADFADDDGRAYPAVPTLAAKCRTTPRHTNRILAGLRASGELEIRVNEGPRGTNLYRVALDSIAPEGMTSTSPLTPTSPLTRRSAPPDAHVPKPLTPTSDEPSLNHHEPPKNAKSHSEATASGSVAKKLSKARSPKASEALTAATWRTYSDAYRQRYGVDPVRGAAVNSKLAQFVRTVGEQEAPAIAALYVQSEEPFYVREMHKVGLLLSDAEKLRTQWKTGHRSSKATRDFQNTDYDAGVSNGRVAL